MSSEPIACYFAPSLAKERLHYGYIELYDDGRWFAWDGLMMRRIETENLPSDMIEIYPTSILFPHSEPSE